MTRNPPRRLRRKRASRSLLRAMGAPRLWVIFLLVLCAIVIVAHQSSAPVTEIFLSRKQAKRKVVTLADLGTSLGGLSSEAGEGGGSWKEKLGGLLRGEGERTSLRGGKMGDEATGGEIKVWGGASEKGGESDVSKVEADVREVEDEVSEVEAEVSEQEEELVVDWGLLTSPMEEQKVKGATFAAKEAKSDGIVLGGSQKESSLGGEDESFIKTTPVEKPIFGAMGDVIRKAPVAPKGLTCREWLVSGWEVWESGFRNFTEQPVQISDSGARSWFETTEEDLRGCDIGCELHSAGTLASPDASTEHWVGELQPGTSSSGLVVIRNVESFTNYPSVATHQAKAHAVDIVSNFHLDSDVPHVYFSWSGCAFNLRGNDCRGLEIMAPLGKEPKEDAAAAFISNCEARNFRTEAVKELIANDIVVHNYGDCVHTADLPGDVKGYDESKYGSKYNKKLVQFQRHKFALAFENSCEEDYVTEKFFHALAAGTVPVVVGAQNTAEFAPAPNSFLQIGSVEEIPEIADKMRYLMENETAYDEMLTWKKLGPSDAFKALMDLQAVHPTCRLCQHVADRIRTHQEAGKSGLPPHQCRETLKGTKQTSYLLIVRERGRSEFRPLVLNAVALRGIASFEAAILEEFRKLGHEPVWLGTRVSAGVKTNDWRIYRVYPAGTTQRQALYGQRTWRSDMELLDYLVRNPCPKLEVIFV